MNRGDVHIGDKYDASNSGQQAINSGGGSASVTDDGLPLSAKILRVLVPVLVAIIAAIAGWRQLQPPEPSPPPTPNAININVRKG